MTRARARSYTEQEKLDLYNNWNWSCFVQAERDEATIRLGKEFPADEIKRMADMSAGGAKISPEIATFYGAELLLGDYSWQYGYHYIGPLTHTVPLIEPPVDLWVCSETIEHLEDPDNDLALIRDHTNYLLLTTPIAEKGTEVSHGHLWTWEEPDVTDMLKTAGFKVLEYEEVIGFFGVWRCN